MIYLTNGNTPLNAAYADEIVQEDNSTYQLTFRFPTSDSLWEKLKEETFLTADDLHGEQDFVIFEVEKRHGYIQVYANQVFTLLNNYVVNPISLDRQTGSTALSRFAGSITRDNPFSFFSDIEDRHTFNIGSKNAMEAFAKDKHSIIGQWGGDLVRHGCQVRLLKNGGSENESLFMYKKNLSSYQHKTSTKSLKTRITFITTVKGEGEKAPDRTFTVTIDSPLINKYSQIYEDVIEVNDQDVKDEASLRKYGEQYYRTSLCDMMEDSLEIEVVGQSDVPVQMFDVVSIFHEQYNLDVRKKITKYTYSPMATKLKSIGFGQFQSGLAHAIGNAVSDAVKGEAQQLQSNFEQQLARELKNADLAFDRQKEDLVNQFQDGMNAAYSKNEEVRMELYDAIDRRFQEFDDGPINQIRLRADEILRQAGASSLLAQEAKRIGLDSVAKLEEFKRQATSAQTALSGDLDVLKRTVNNEVNQASEYRRTTTEALSRMTGQMDGFATKSEVKQDIDGLTQTFAKMRIGGTNLYVLSNNKDISRSSHLTDLKFDISSGEISFQATGLDPYFGEATVHPKAASDRNGVRIPVIFGKAIYVTVSNPIFIKNYISYFDKNGNTVKSYKSYKSSSFVISPKELEGANFITIRFGCGGSDFEIGSVIKTKIKVEYGTIPTDWSPAPEDTEGLITEAKATFERTAQGLRTDLSAIQEYVGQDGQRQEVLQRYAREESAKQATAVRELVNRDFVGKATYQEDVQGIERRFSAISTQTNNDIATKIAQYKQTVDGRFADITSLMSSKANQTDFQRVQETSQLYERILGNTDNGIANNVARMALTNQLFQVEVGKAAQKGRNYYRDSEKIQTKTRFFTFPLHPYLSQENIGETWTLSFDLKINEGGEIRPLHFYHYQANRFGIKASGDITPSKEWQRFTFTGSVIFPNDDPRYARGEMALYDFAGNNSYSVRRIKFERGTVATPWAPSPEDNDEAIRSVQSQLAGSWAVQNINSAGDIISGINLGSNGHNRFDGKLTHITGETLIDNAVIKSAMVDKLKTANFEAGSVTTVVLDAEAVTAEKLKIDQAFFNKLVANEAYLSQLFAKQAFINRVQSISIDASQIKTGVLTGGKILGGTITGSSIAGGTITGSSISGATLTGHTKIQLGTYGSFDTVDGGLQINVPRTVNSKDGLGVQFIGSYGRGTNVPYGLYIYKDSDLTTNSTALQSDDFIMTVEGYIKAKGIGWFKTDTSSVNGKLTATIGLWNSNNVSLAFGGSGNDIYYSYNGTAYSLWSVVKQHFSDRRLKENIVDCKHKALDYIQQFQFKEYDWKKQDDRPQQAHTKIGLIAQEVQAVDPTLVYENGDTLNLDNLRLTNIALKAIQELSQRIEILERKIA